MKNSSKDKIKLAFIELIETKGLESTTITDITRKAKINRGTFYLSYADKYELLYTLENEFIQSILNKLMPLFTDPNCINIPHIDNLNITITILNIIYEERNLIRALLSTNGDPGFLTQVKKEIFRYLLEDNFFENMHHSSFAKMPKDYLEEVILSGLSTIIIHWLSKDCLESVDEIAEILLHTNFAAPILNKIELLTKQNNKN